MYDFLDIHTITITISAAAATSYLFPVCQFGFFGSCSWRWWEWLEKKKKKEIDPRRCSFLRGGVGS